MPRKVTAGRQGSAKEARDLGVSIGTVRAWLGDAADSFAGAFGGVT